MLSRVKSIEAPTQFLHKPHITANSVLITSQFLMHSVRCGGTVSTWFKLDNSCLSFLSFAICNNISNHSKIFLPISKHRSTQPCIPLGSLNRVPALIGWAKGRNVTSAGWQVTLCDPMWHMSSCSGKACCQLHDYFTLPKFCT